MHAAPPDGGGAGAVAEMQGNEVELCERPPQVVRRLPGNKGVGGAVEPVPADPVLLVELLRQSVTVGSRRECLVECRVEHRHLRNTGETYPGSFDTEKIGGIVERGQGNKTADGGHHLVIDHGRLTEQLPAVHHPVADAEEFRIVPDDAVFPVHVDHEMEGLVVIGERLRIDLLNEGPVSLAVGSAACSFRRCRSFPPVPWRA